VALGDRLGEANTLIDLGPVRQQTGDYQAAIGDLGQALGISRDLGDRLDQANALYYLARARRLTGNYHAAAPDLEQALGIYGDLGDPLGQANPIGNLGTVRRLTDDHQAADHDLKQALDIYRRLRRARYLITVKRNQPALHAQLAGLPWRQIPAADISHDRAHGRAGRQLTDYLRWQRHSESCPPWRNQHRLCYRLEASGSVIPDIMIAAAFLRQVSSVVTRGYAFGSMRFSAVIKRVAEAK
jgi:tetratricopeptide (TPR) repeat protein